jgi:hypothetical protein
MQLMSDNIIPGGDHMRLVRTLFAASAVVLIVSQACVPGQAQAGSSQAPLFFREDWNGRKATGFQPLTQGDIGNPDLLVQLYGPGAVGADRNAENTLDVTVRQPAPNGGPDQALNFIWSGMSEGNWAVTLKHKDRYVDLSRPGAKIRWRTWQDGAVQTLRPVLKLADGTYALGLQGTPASADYVTADLIIANEQWVDFDPVRVLERGTQASTFGYIKPDLSRVDEIGITTLSRGGGHGATGAAAHVDWIEVYGTGVPR